jgi:hypothetical protein
MSWLQAVELITVPRTVYSPHMCGCLKEMPLHLLLPCPAFRVEVEVEEGMRQGATQQTSSRDLASRVCLRGTTLRS